MMAATRPNPYPGPRSFLQGERLFGRERETAELLDLLIAERILLLYSPSGAGKTSLVQAALIPKLEAEGFRVLPIIRTGFSAGDGDIAPANRYVMSLLLSLERDRAEAKQTSLAELASLSLCDYLDRRPAPEGNGWHGDVLIFDQFEEILTLAPSDREARAGCFEQIGQALRDRSRWALFSMREEFVAGLDPYLRPIPTRFDKGHRYRLDLLSPEAAREAMKEPARTAGVEFTDTAADKLIDDLRSVRVQQGDGTTVAVPGDMIEPVQLQVVCRRLWDGLTPDDRSIDLDDIQNVGDVDTALRSYYADSIEAVRDKTGIRERLIRDWMDAQLITAQGIRGQVLLGPDVSPPDRNGLANRAIWSLVDTHLVRAEQRRGATWFELAHDRLLGPIRKDNTDWREHNLSALQRQAELWEQGDRPEGLLFSGDALGEAERWAATHVDELEAFETTFLAACRKQKARIRRERRQNQWIRVLAVIATLVGIVAVGAAISARHNAKIAYTNATEAVRQANLALSRELAAASVANLSRDPELSLLLAQQGIQHTYTLEAEDALRRALQTSRIVARYADAGTSLRKAVYSPDGSHLAAATDDGAVYVWDLRSGPGDGAVLKWPGQGGAIMDLAYSPDGAMLATAHADKMARVWHAKSGVLLRTFSGHFLEVLSVAFSPDGSHIATGSTDKIIRIWDIASPETSPLELYGHTGGIADLAYSRSGARLATAGRDGRVAIWDTGSGAEVQTVQEQGESVYAVAFSPDERLLATASRDKTAVLWDISGQMSRKIQTLYDHTNSVADITFSPNGRCLATASLDRTAKVWEAATGRLLLNLPGHQDWVSSVAFQPSAATEETPPDIEQCGRRLATASHDGSVRVWNIGAVHEAAVLTGHHGPVESAVFTPDGGRVVTASDDGTARVWDLSTGDTLAELRGHRDFVTRAEVSADGRYVATASGDGSAALWDAATGAPIASLSDPEAERVLGVAFSPDGTLLTTVGDSGNAIQWDVPSGQMRKEYQHGGKVYGVAYSPDGTTLVTTGEKGRIKLWDLGSGRLQATLQHGTQEVYDAAFSPDGTQLATANWDASVQLWAMPGGAPGYLLRGHRDRVYGVRFSPDGRQLATSGADGSIKLWDTASGQIIRQLPGPASNGLDFSPDGGWLIAGSEDGTARLYTLEPERLLRLAADRLTRSWTQEECEQYLHMGACPTAQEKGGNP